MNAITRHELFVLDDGEKPVEVTEDTKIPNAATVMIAKQDHTLGNMVRAQLLQNPAVLFAGYKVPHPIRPQFLIKIQTDGTITPQTALEQACNKLIVTITALETKFKREFAFRDVEGGTTSGGGIGGIGSSGDDPYNSGTGWSGGKDYLDF
ncbi:hypothetical protein ONZ45_g6420 [Pleurotus djamor]|nr:hypothetical protein ONZ45_g6420 [Pleurotus djamor]